MSKAKTQFDYKNFLANLTTKPGIYRMYDASDSTLYVGKAKNLKKRVSSYFKGQVTGKTQVLVAQIAKIDVTVTENENDALILEANLIKSLRPKYNVLLRDDKSYPYIFVSTQDKYPRLDIYRGAKKQKGLFFGPFPSASAAKFSLNFIQKCFSVRQCRNTFFNNRSRPCLQYQIKRCSAPCVEYITPEAYGHDVEQAVQFLKGDSNALIVQMMADMQAASENLEYERAALLRDKIKLLRQTHNTQSLVGKQADIDVIHLATEQEYRCILVLYVRDGECLGSKPYFFKQDQTSDDELLMTFIGQYYLRNTENQLVPGTILVNIKLSEQDWLMSALTSVASHTVKLQQRVRGNKQQWQEMAAENAQVALRNHLATVDAKQSRLHALEKILQLSAPIKRVECFDISHTMGEATVASCVVFNTEGPVKEDYRRFNIKDITPGDDYAAMRQAITRRYTRLKSESEPESWPDLIILDGGKGQLSQFIEVMEELQLSDIHVIAVAKGPSRKAGQETLFLETTKNEIDLPAHSPALHFIQAIRDEAHRFAITGHRNRRQKSRNTSVLESIDGIGAKRRKAILSYFGGLKAIQNASIRELAQAPGISLALAEKIYEALHEE